MRDSPPEKYFCFKCGKQCTKTQYVISYRVESGEPYYGYRFTCPSNSWASWHENTSFTEDGHKLVVYR